MSVANQISTNISQGGGEAPPSNPQTPTEGVPPGDPPPAAAQNEPVDFSRQFNALTRRERAIVERENALKESSQQLTEYQDGLKALKENPLAFLEKHGVDAKSVAGMLLNDGKPDEKSKIDELMGRLDKFESDREQEKLTAEEQRKLDEQEKTISNFKENLKKTVSENNEAFELINSMDQYDLVYDVIEQHHNKHGEILQVDKAAEAVENYLDQQLDKIAETAKFKKKFGSLATQTEPETPQAPSNGIKDRPKPFAETLTNSDAATATKPYSSALSREDSINSATAMLQKQLDAAKYGKEL